MTVEELLEHEIKIEAKKAITYRDIQKENIEMGIDFRGGYIYFYNRKKQTETKNRWYITQTNDPSMMAAYKELFEEWKLENQRHYKVIIT